MLNRLVDNKNSVLVIEHNLDVIKTADWLIEMGPEGGEGGGSVVAVGPPEVIAACAESHTGRFLKEIFEKEGHSLEPQTGEQEEDADAVADEAVELTQAA